MSTASAAPAAAKKKGSGVDGCHAEASAAACSCRSPCCPPPRCCCASARTCFGTRPRAGVHQQGRQGLHVRRWRRAPRQHGAAVLRRYRDRLRQEVRRLHRAGRGHRLPGLQERARHVHRSNLPKIATAVDGKVVMDDAPVEPEVSSAAWSWACVVRRCSGRSSTAPSWSTGWASSTAAASSRSSSAFAGTAIGIVFGLIWPVLGTGLHNFGEWLVGLGRGRRRHLRCGQPRPAAVGMHQL